MPARKSSTAWLQPEDDSLGRTEAPRFLDDFTQGGVREALRVFVEIVGTT